MSEYFDSYDVVLITHRKRSMQSLDCGFLGGVDPKALSDTTIFCAIEFPDLITWRFTFLSYHGPTDLFIPLLSV
jgi:hypothetical protein